VPVDFLTAERLILRELLSTREQPSERERRILKKSQDTDKKRWWTTHRVPVQGKGRFAFWKKGEPILSSAGGYQCPHREN
jgi:hypothetical protein